MNDNAFSRRNFFRIAGTGVLGYYFSDVLQPRTLLAQTIGTNAALRNTAKSCIFIFLAGAPSQTDMWDLKEGSWTPTDLAPTPYGSMRWPQGLLPKMGAHLDKLTIARSCLAWAAVHELGQAWAQIARNPGGATGAIAPHIGAVVALESQAKRTPAEVLPGFIALNAGSIPTCGYLPAKYAPFGVTTASTGLATLGHPDGAARFTRRWDLIHQLDTNRTTGALGKAASDMNDFYDQSKALMDSPNINALFSFTTEEHDRYGASNFGDSLVVARNLVASGKGTRFVQATQGGWDHHSDIYDTAAAQSLFVQGKQLDDAVGALLTDLAAMKILDQTLVVIVSEFGRTVGALNNQGGRDHYLRNSVVFAGGGTRGGRAIGATNAQGNAVAEYGWSANRDIRPEDVTCTLYSALGIDYTKVRNDDPLGRGFEYVPTAKDGGYQPIEELWT
ncbi:MAG TPA: DUF1501 domain-containing protein [Thermoanaerobaculia bacterium]|nr:DUF1501 domain-containing protein [Thermoanaerobaculia bacterium]